MKPGITDWNTEFPFLFNLVHDPKQFLADIPVNLQRSFYKLVFISTWMLILYIALTYVLGTGQESIVQVNQLKQHLIQIFKNFRNIVYLVYVFDVPLLLFASISLVRQNQFAKLLKIGIEWIGLLMFVTFAYAISGLVVDLCRTLTFLLTRGY